MSDMVNLVKQFAEANTQEQKWLRDNIKDLQAVIGSMVHQMGGVAKIPKRDMLIQMRIKVTEDVHNRCYVLEIV